MKAHSGIVDEVDGRHPTRSIFRLLGRHKRGVSFAVFFFALKETPVWLLPVITGAVIDIVVSGGPASSLLLWSLIAFVALAQNFPNHLLYTRFFMRAVRQTGADLRNAVA